MPSNTISGSTRSIPARLDLLDSVRTDFTQFLRERKLDGTAINDWQLILSEALANAIVHGCQEDPSRSVEITWTHRGYEIVLEVQDTGQGPDQLLARMPDLPDNDLETGGRGRYILFARCDSYEELKGPSGFRQIMRKQHDDIQPYNPSDDLLDATLEELNQCYESLSAFYRLGDALLRYDSVASFLQGVVEDIRKVISDGKISITFKEELHQSILVEVGHLQFYVPPNAACFLQLQVLDSGVEQAWDEAHGQHCQCEALHGCRSGFSMPLTAAGETIGVMTLARDDTENRLNASELNTLRTFAELIGIAVANQNNSIIRTNEQQAFRELEIASDIQQSLLPKPLPQEHDHWHAYAERKGAREVAGDYVDICYGNDGSVYLVIVDVMGKGISSAFLAAIFRTALYIIINIHPKLSDLVSALNQILYAQVGDATMFATACIARYQPGTEQMEIVNAGHCPALLCSEHSTTLAEIEPSGPPLGIFETMPYEIETFTVEPKTKLIMLTDGLYEWMQGGQIFGWSRLRQFIIEQIEAKPQQLWQQLQNLIDNQSDDEDHADDQTLLYWERK